MSDDDPIKLRRFDFYPADYLEGISDLDDDHQVAVYTVAFVVMYARSGPIANDAKWINRMAKCRSVSDCRRHLDALINKQKLIEVDGGRRLINGRAARELDRTVRRVQNARANGRAGGRPIRPRTVADTFEDGSRKVRELSLEKPESVENQSPKKPGGYHQSSVIDQQSYTDHKSPPPSHTSSDAAREGAPNGASARAPKQGLLDEKWKPSDALLAQIRRGRPDLVGTFYDQRWADWLDWIRAKAPTTFNIESTFSSFMRNSKAPPRQSEAERDAERAEVIRKATGKKP